MPSAQNIHTPENRLAHTMPTYSHCGVGASSTLQRHNGPRALLLELDLSILLKGMQIQVLESFCRAFNESHPAFIELSTKVILPSKSLWTVFPRKNKIWIAKICKYELYESSEGFFCVCWYVPVTPLWVSIVGDHSELNSCYNQTHAPITNMNMQPQK